MFQKGCFYFDGWSKRSLNNSIPKYAIDKIEKNYNWKIPEQPNKQDTRKWEKIITLLLRRGLLQI